MQLSGFVTRCLLVCAARGASAAQDVEVIIVGAGWAGMAAADALVRANVNVTVLEASGHTGGRSHAMKFGSAGVKQFIIERGSNWVSGGCLGRTGACGAGGAAMGMEHLPSENPVWTLGKKSLQRPLPKPFAYHSPTHSSPFANHHHHHPNTARQENFSVKAIPGSADGNMSDYEAVYTPEGVITGDPGGRIRERANQVRAANTLTQLCRSHLFVISVRLCGVCACIARHWIVSMPQDQAAPWV